MILYHFCENVLRESNEVNTTLIIRPKGYLLEGAKQ